MTSSSATGKACLSVQVLQGGKGQQAILALPADEDKLKAAAQLVIGAAAIYDESVSSVTGSQVLYSQLASVMFATNTNAGAVYMLLSQSCSIVSSSSLVDSVLVRGPCKQAHHGRLEGSSECALCQKAGVVGTTGVSSRACLMHHSMHSAKKARAQCTIQAGTWMWCLTVPLLAI